MGIKDKPLNLQTNDVEQFRSYDPEIPAHNKQTGEVLQNTSGTDARITKTVRMRHRYGQMLKEEAYNRSMTSGTKVSEADLLDEALGDFRFKLQTKKGD